MQLPAPRGNGKGPRGSSVDVLVTSETMPGGHAGGVAGPMMVWSHGASGCPSIAHGRPELKDNLGFRSIDDFEQGDVIGHGTFCKVVRCTDSISGREYALKLVAKGEPVVDAVCAMEAHCLRRLARSSLIVTLLWDMDDGTQWAALMELCEGGNLWCHVRHCGCLMVGESAWYASQMVEALAAVHAVGIAHRDVRCENFLLAGAARSIRLIDFGTARDTANPSIPPVPRPKGESEHRVGGPHFMAPEASRGEANDRRSDLWSLGCALYQLVLGVPPFRSLSADLVQARARAADLWFPTHGITECERDLIARLVRRDPAMRLGAHQTRALLQHPLLQDPPLDFPAETPLIRGLRLVARAVDLEAAAASTAIVDGALAPACCYECPAEIFEGAKISSQSPETGLPEVGSATASLLEELPCALGIDVDCNTTAQSQPEEALLEVVRLSAARAAEAGPPHDIADGLARTCADAANDPTAMPAGLELPAFAFGLLARFSDLARERKARCSAQPGCFSPDSGSGAGAFHLNDSVFEYDSSITRQASGDSDIVGPASCLAESLLSARGTGGRKALPDEAAMTPPKDTLAVSLQRPGLSKGGSRTFASSLPINIAATPVFLPCAAAEPCPPPEPLSPVSDLQKVDVVIEAGCKAQEAEAQDQSDVDAPSKPPAVRVCCCLRRLRR